MRIILLGAALLSLAACGREAEPPAGPETPEAPAPAGNAAPPEAENAAALETAPQSAAGPEEREYSFQEETAFASVSVDTPEAPLSRDQALYERVYVRSRDYAEVFLQTAQQHAAEAEGQYEFRPYDLTVQWAAPFVSEEVASLVSLTGEYTGGAHPNSFYSTLNWSYAEQDAIDATELFIDAPATWEQLSELAREALIAEKQARLREAGLEISDDMMWMDAIEDATAPNAESFENLALVPSTEAGKAGGIRLYYSPYEVGAYAEGAYVTTIPQAEFAGLAAEPYTALFAGEPVPGEAGTGR